MLGSGSSAHFKRGLLWSCTKIHKQPCRPHWAVRAIQDEESSVEQRRMKWSLSVLFPMHTGPKHPKLPDNISLSLFMLLPSFSLTHSACIGAGEILVNVAQWKLFVCSGAGPLQGVDNGGTLQRQMLPLHLTPQCDPLRKQREGNGAHDHFNQPGCPQFFCTKFHCLHGAALYLFSDGPHKWYNMAGCSCHLQSLA